jgi:serine/threonine protein phosphatase PrpC
VWGAASHPGGRTEQQDRWEVLTWPDRNSLLTVIADGMGGHLEGALGAQAVIEATSRFARDQRQLFVEHPQEALVQLCQQCQSTLVAASALAHSTVVTLWLHRDQAHWMHVGDSRLYHLREGKRLLRTRDHSVAQMLMELGEISEAEIANHPDQNRLYRSLGSEEPPKPELGGGQVQRGDLFVICSDGFWEHVSETEAWEASCQAGDLAAAAADLVTLATTRGGARADNATLILIRPVAPKMGNWLWLSQLLNTARLRHSLNRWLARVPPNVSARYQRSNDVASTVWIYYDTASRLTGHDILS